MSAAPLVQRVDDRSECESWASLGGGEKQVCICPRIFANGLGTVYGPSLSSRAVRLFAFRIVFVLDMNHDPFWQRLCHQRLAVGPLFNERDLETAAHLLLDHRHSIVPYLIKQV